MPDLVLKFKVDDNGAIKVTDQLGNEIKQVGDESDKASPKTDKLSKTFGGVKVAVLAALAAITAFIAGSVKLAKVAAVAKDTRVAFNNLAASAGLAAGEMLTKMKAATAGTISEFQLMQKVSSAVLLGLPIDRFDDMLAVARGASKATGETMEFMLNSIVTGLGRGSKLMLDNLGILFDVDKANKDYAKSLGKTSTELTELERKQAFVNAALDVGIANLAKIGDLAASDADEFARLDANTENLSIAVGKQLSPALAVASGFLADIAEDLTNFLDPGSISNQIDIIEEKIQALADKKYKFSFIEFFEKGGENIESLRAQLALLEKEQAENQARIARNLELKKAEQAAADAAKAAAEELIRVRQAQMFNANATLDAQEELSTKRSESLQDELDEYSDWVDSLNEKDKERLDSQAEAVSKAAAIVGDFADLQFNKEKARIQATLEEEIKAVQATTASAEQKAALISNLRTKAEAEERAAAQKRKPLLIAEATANIALAVTKAFASAPPPFNFILGGLTAVAGAIELATINAQAFADGTFDAPGGLSVVGERGPELVNLPPGSQVTPAEDSQVGGDVVVMLDGEVIARVAAPHLVRMSDKKQTTLQTS